VSRIRGRQVGQSMLTLSVDAAASWFGQNLRATRAFQIAVIGVGAAVVAPIIVGGVLGAVEFGAGGVVARGCCFKYRHPPHNCSQLYRLCCKA